MKKITSAVLGLSLTLAAAGMSFAQTTAPQTTDPTKPAATAKKHKKVKKSKATTPAPAAAAAPSK